MHVGAFRIANETLKLSRQPPLVVTPEMLGIRFESYHDRLSFVVIQIFVPLCCELHFLDMTSMQHTCTMAKLTCEL
ncbi:unnamed protein product [Sphagnum compactum]